MGVSISSSADLVPIAGGRGRLTHALTRPRPRSRSRSRTGWEKNSLRSVTCDSMMYQRV